MLTKFIGMQGVGLKAFLLTAFRGFASLYAWIFAVPGEGDTGLFLKRPFGQYKGPIACSTQAS